MKMSTNREEAGQDVGACQGYARVTPFLATPATSQDFLSGNLFGYFAVFLVDYGDISLDQVILFELKTIIICSNVVLSLLGKLLKLAQTAFGVQDVSPNHLLGI